MTHKMEDTAVCACVAIAMLSFVALFCESSFLPDCAPVAHDALFEFVGGDGEAIPPKRCESGCHFSCRRHGCSWYNSPCRKKNPDDPPGTPLCPGPTPKVPLDRTVVVNADCHDKGYPTVGDKPAGKDTCNLELVPVRANTCKYTGEVDLESVGCEKKEGDGGKGNPSECKPPELPEWRCKIDFDKKWGDNLDTVVVYREKSNSLQCANDPARYDSTTGTGDEPVGADGKHRAVCNDFVVKKDHGERNCYPRDSNEPDQPNRLAITQFQFSHEKDANGKWCIFVRKRTGTRNTLADKWTWGQLVEVHKRELKSGESPDDIIKELRGTFQCPPDYPIEV